MQRQRRAAMDNGATSSELVSLLNEALARELQVCVQYMLQHAIGAGRRRAPYGGTSSDRQGSFIASHALYFLPGPRLKKIAITEMRHAEAIAERVVLLGGEPTAQPAAITIGDTAKQMLQIDTAAEQMAIDLYRHITSVARSASDEATARLFERILSDEEQHHRVFAGLLGES
jgi:bacterioferritin